MFFQEVISTRPNACQCSLEWASLDGAMASLRTRECQGHATSSHRDPVETAGPVAQRIRARGYEPPTVLGVRIPPLVGHHRAPKYVMM